MPEGRATCRVRHTPWRQYTCPPAAANPRPQILEGNKYLLQALGSGLWPVMVLLSEVVQTFVLAGFWWVQEKGVCTVLAGCVCWGR